MGNIITKKRNKGFITTYVLVFGVVFLILLTALLGFILSQMKQARYELAQEQALHIAEAGLNRYWWYLVRKNQEILQGEEIGCPPSDCFDCSDCEYEYLLPGLDIEGKYQLEVDEVRTCGVTGAVTVTATGWTSQFPNFKRAIRVRYVQPTVAEYSYILNDNVWAGADRIIMGPYHSNGGIRMDGQNNSLVASEQEEWICTSSFGCPPCPDVCELRQNTCFCPGVFTTAHGNEELFRTGANHFDFDGITIDLGRIKKLSQPAPEGEGQGLYFPPSQKGASPTQRSGYYVILKGRSIEVREIVLLNSVRAYSLEDDWHWEDSLIRSTSAAKTYSLGECGLVFFEDNVWIEGRVEGKITMASANLSVAGQDTDIWLKNNIVYTTDSKEDGLVLIGQRNVLIAPDSPDYLDLHGVYIAQTGRFGRNHYSDARYAKKEELKIYGTIVSNKRVGTQWISGGVWISGYRERQNIFDPQLSYYPPPFLPAISENFRYKGWEEIR